MSDMTKNDYTIKRITTDDDCLEQCMQLLSAIFFKDDKFSVDYLKWQYMDNPAGEVFGYNAYYGSQLAAHYATIPVNYSIQGERMPGLLSINTATHVDHQGQGLFRLLATRTFEQAAQKGYRFVIGVSNQNSTHGFVNKYGFRLITPLSVKVGIGRVSTNRTSRDQVYAVRDPEFIKWRLNKPGNQYFRDGQTIASRFKLGISTQLLHDKDQICEINGRGKLLFNVWIGNVRDRKLRGIFTNLPGFLRTSPLNLIFKDLTGNISPFTRDEIFFELIDFDIF